MLILLGHLVDSSALFEVSFLFKYLPSPIYQNKVWYPLKGAVRCHPVCLPWSDTSLVPPGASYPAPHSVLTKTTCPTALEHRGVVAGMYERGEGLRVNAWHRSIRIYIAAC